MASGAKVDDEVKDIFRQMKIAKSGDERIRVVSLHIDEDIKVETIYRQKDVGDQCVLTFLRSLMKADSCRYYLYDCHFETKENLKKEELVFILWAPEGAGCKGRMKYASSKSAMEKVFDGIKHKMQVNEIADMDLDNFTDELSSKVGSKISTVEGKVIGQG